MLNSRHLVERVFTCTFFLHGKVLEWCWKGVGVGVGLEEKGKEGKGVGRVVAAILF
jgi:hypothetical protein